MASNARHILSESLMKQHHVTAISNFWRDYFLLPSWHLSEQPVVYLGDVFNNYKLQRRLGSWCWLAEHLPTRQYKTVKFLPRTRRGLAELQTNKFIFEKSRSRHLAIMTDHFEVPHHMATTNPDYKDITFNAIAYEVTGRDLRRCFQEWAQPLSLNQKKHCIRDLVRGVAELHRLGIVHGDIHPGNVALPEPTAATISQVLAEQPTVSEIRRKDGKPTHPTLPQRVTEPVDIGFGQGAAKLFDFGFAFLFHSGNSYTKNDFARGTPRPPELVPAESSTTRPFLVDSWHLGLTIYFIATDGASFVDEVGCDEEQLKHIRDQLARLEGGHNEFIEQLPGKFKHEVNKILIPLLLPDPLQRLSIVDLAQNEWLAAEEL